MIYFYGIIGKKKGENVKIAGMFPGKNIFDHRKSAAILIYESLTKRSSSHCWFQFTLILRQIQKKKKGRKEGKQNKYFVEKILRHYRKSFCVVMETQKAQARIKKSE